MDAIKYLRKLVFDGASSKRLEFNDLVLDRLNHELSVIEELNCAEYFIIYSKIIEICNRLGLLRSYGRGSACCSLVNYCLDLLILK
jgi:DNA polymerase III alpha subunit